MRGIFITGSFALLIAAGSCNLNLCEEPTDVRFNLGFYTLDDGRVRDSVVSGLIVYGIGREDSLVYDQAVRKKITLPLNQVSDTSRFFIGIGDTGDICTIRYTRSVRLISHDCGFVTEFDIVDFSHTNTFVDSVAIAKSKVTNFEEEHVKIFL